MMNLQQKLERHRQAQRAWADRNKEKLPEIARRYRQSHLEDCKARERENSKRYYHAHKEKSKEYATRWALNNPERRAEIVRKSRKKNRGPRNYWRSVERARLRNATPVWADRKRMKAIYAESSSLTKATGIKHHVDHVIPLASENVCGLHVESNLQILTAAMNQRKSNLFAPNTEPPKGTP